MKLEDYFILKQFKMHRLIDLTVNRKLAHLKITIQQIFILKCISDDIDTKSRLSRELKCDRTTITRCINIIINNKWIEQNNSKDDKRELILSLTKAGKEVLDKSVRYLDDCDNTISFLWNKAAMKATEELFEKEGFSIGKQVAASTQLLKTIRYFIDAMENHKWV
jgi:DNA-binding MarR family transcriptional regulator